MKEKTVTVVLRGEGAEIAVRRAKARKTTPDELVLSLLQTEEKRVEALRRAWTPERGAALSHALSAYFAEAREAKAKAKAAAEPAPDGAKAGPNDHA